MGVTCVWPVQVYAHAGAVLDGRLYVACGCRGLTYLKETYCFDPGANTWTACAEGPVERAWHAMATLDGRIYVIGGSNDEFKYRRDVLSVQFTNATRDIIIVDAGTDDQLTCSLRSGGLLSP